MRDFSQRAEVIKGIAQSMGWTLEQHQENIDLLIFVREGIQMNVYYSKMTVATSMKHPTLGFTQLYRRNVGYGLLKHLMDHPRLHTGKGYYHKSEGRV